MSSGSSLFESYVSNTTFCSFFETLEFLGAKIDPKMAETLMGKIDKNLTSSQNRPPGIPKGLRDSKIMPKWFPGYENCAQRSLKNKSKQHNDWYSEPKAIAQICCLRNGFALLVPIVAVFKGYYANRL